MTATLRRSDATARAGAILFGASVALLGLILTATGLRLDPDGFGVLLGFSGAALLIGLAMKATGSLGRVANLTVIAAALLGTTLTNILSLNAGLRLRLPLVDADLRTADAAFGLDAVKLVEAFAAHPRLTHVLDLVYVNANWLAAVAVIGCGLRRQRPAQALICYAGGLLAVTVVSTLLPALGNIAYMGLGELPGLPPGSGTYHLPAFRYYHDGAGASLGAAHLSGVAVFPSFHVVMGLVIATSLHGTRLAPLGLFAGAATIVSAVPIGGHYMVDVFAAVLLWAGLMRVGEAPAARTRADRATSRRTAVPA